jgi:polyribonucleotide nucleotidyltransferase
MATFVIAPESVGKLIGPGGKQIRAVIEDFNLVNLDVNDEGRIQMSSFDSAKLVEAEEFVKKLVEGRGGAKDKKERAAYGGPPPVEGNIYTGKITGVHAFGVFVEILPGAEDGSYPGLEGLCHVSELAKDRVRNCEGYIKSMGVEELTVKYIGTQKGKIQLSRKAAMEELSGGKKTVEKSQEPNGAQAEMDKDELEVIAMALEKASEL